MEENQEIQEEEVKIRKPQDRAKKNKKWVIREISKRARFSIKDVYEILQTFEDIIAETVRKREKMTYTGLFKIRVAEIVAHTGWDAVRNEKMFIDTSYKIVIKPSRSLLQLVRTKDSDYDEDDYDDDEDYEE